MTVPTPQILYEDNHVLVAMKPAGILSQADISGDPDMLTLLKADLKMRYQKPGDVYLGLLHRLDRPVAGVMVFAKTSKCASRISAQIRERRVDKSYSAVVYGEMVPPKGRLTGLIHKDSVRNQSSLLKEDEFGDAKPADLEYDTIEVRVAEGPSQTISLLHIQLHTGRSHQIRLQLSSAGCPIVGDRKYGVNDHAYRGEICLYASALSFNHPITGERLHFRAPVPEEWPWTLFKEDSSDE